MENPEPMLAWKKYQKERAPLSKKTSQIRPLSDQFNKKGTGNSESHSNVFIKLPEKCLLKKLSSWYLFWGRRKRRRKQKIFFYYYLTLILQRHSSYYSFYFDLLHLKNMLSFKQIYSFQLHLTSFVRSSFIFSSLFLNVYLYKWLPLY